MAEDSGLGGREECAVWGYLAGPVPTGGAVGDAVRCKVEVVEDDRSFQFSLSGTLSLHHLPLEQSGRGRVTKGTVFNFNRPGSCPSSDTYLVGGLV